MFTANLLAQHTCGTISIPWVYILYFSKETHPPENRENQIQQPKNPKTKNPIKDPNNKTPNYHKQEKKKKK